MIKLEKLEHKFDFITTNNKKKKIIVDASLGFGGENQGFNPIELLLASLGSCAGIHLIDELQGTNIKIKKIEVEKVNVYLIGIKFILETNDKPINNLDKIIEKVIKICPVSNMLDPKIKIHHKYILKKCK